MVLDHSFEKGTLTRETVMWPGSANEVRSMATRLHDTWRKKLEGLNDEDLRSPQLTRWPFQDVHLLT